MTPENATLRKRLRLSTARFLAHGALYRQGTAVDLIEGFAYTKRSSNEKIRFPGIVADMPIGYYFMVLYPDELPEMLVGDVLLMNGSRYNVMAVHDMQAYVTLRLEQVFDPS